jgi:hypothetical protein
MHESPATHEWSNSDVEGAFGFTVKPLNVLQKLKEGRLNAHRFACGAGIETGDFTGWSVKAKLFLEPLNFAQGFLTGGPQGRFTPTMENNFKAGGHGMARQSDHNA